MGKMRCLGLLALVAGLGLTAAAAYDLKPSAIVPRWQGAAPGEWTMDYVTATNAAAQAGKYTLQLVSGMWWCPHCQALEEGVLTTEAWSNYVASAGHYLSVLDFPYRDGTSQNCWLWDAGYCAAAGLTTDEGRAEVDRRYMVQDAWSTPGAQRQTVRTWDGTGSITYGRVGYPTLLVIAPGGVIRGRFSVSKNNAALSYVTNRIEQIMRADAADERDDYAATAPAFAFAEDEDVWTDAQTHTLGLTDTVDWYRFDVVEGGSQWQFRFDSEDEAAPRLSVLLTDDPEADAKTAGTTVPADGVTAYGRVLTAGVWYLRVKAAEPTGVVVGYSIAGLHSMSPATVKAKTTLKTVKATASSVSISLSIADAQADAEIAVNWEAMDGTAVEGVDFTGRSGTVTWAAGEKKASKSIVIPLLPAAGWKGDRTFEVVLSPARHSVVPVEASRCQVVIQETFSRKPGSLSFDADAAREKPVIREGGVKTYQVARTGGGDGVVSGVVSVVEGALRKDERVAVLVWGHGDMAPKSFDLQVPPEAGVQQDISSTLKLKPMGGAKSGRYVKCPYVRRDELMDVDFKTYNRAALDSSASVSGDFWFYGSETVGGPSVLRSSVLSAKGSKLTVSLTGPGVLELTALPKNGAAIAASFGSKVLTNGFEGCQFLAVPKGRQKLTLACSRGLSETAYVTAVWTYHPLAECVFSAVRPFDGSKAAVSGQFRLKGASEGEIPTLDHPVTIETYAAASASVKLLPATGSAVPSGGAFAYPEDDGDRSAFDALLMPGRKMYWRMDTVYTDGYGRRAVVTGKRKSFSMLPAAAPVFDDSPAALPSGWTPVAEREVAAPELTVGVETRIGPIVWTAGAFDAVPSAKTTTGKLPPGLSFSCEETGLWIVGVPSKAGSFPVDVHLVGKASGATVYGETLRMNLDVVALDDIVGTYVGFKTDGSAGIDAGAGRGSANLTVSAKGKISGKLYLDGAARSFSVKAFSARSGSVFLIEGTVKVGTEKRQLTMTLDVASEARVADVVACVGEADRFLLYSGDWSESERKALLQEVTGSFTAELPVVESFGETAPHGCGYLTGTVSSSGKVTYAGCDSNGKAFSGSAPIIYVPDCCSASGYRWEFYLDAKPYGSSAGSGTWGLVRLQPDDNSPGVSYLTPADNVGLMTCDLNPTSAYGYGTWSNRLTVAGGTFDATAGVPTEGLWELAADVVLPADADGRDGTSGYLLQAAPKTTDGIVLATHTVSKTVRPAFPANDYDFKVSSYTASTGVFKGSLTLTYEKPGKKPQQKVRTLKGVYLQNTSDGNPRWTCHFTIAEKCDGRSVVTPVPLVFR